MGSGGSKPESDPSQHVFSADSPVRFSQSVIDSLQNSPEVCRPPLIVTNPLSMAENQERLLNRNRGQTDSTRSRNLELQIQARVTEELEKIREIETQRLDEFTSKIAPVSDSPTPSSESSSSSSSSSSADSSSSDSLASQVASALTPSSSSGKDRTRDSVSKEIAELKSKLEKRRKQETMDPSLEKAKESLVQCLRINDRRPLDCYEEVEKFKEEVSKMEKKFVDRAVR
ncbi:hypothetical protein H2203_005983 [Taxawa tesnikishii (nom. ined.)]|nr:hypothetical protein H2203_005983 [Dothideales sp. JES 119]